METALEVNGKPFALLVRDNAGNPRYIAPPLVLDESGAPISADGSASSPEAADILVPYFERHGWTVIRDADPVKRAWVRETLERLSTDLGVPVGWDGGGPVTRRQ